MNCADYHDCKNSRFNIVDCIEIVCCYTIAAPASDAKIIRDLVLSGLGVLYAGEFED